MDERPPAPKKRVSLSEFDQKKHWVIIGGEAHYQDALRGIVRDRRPGQKEVTFRAIIVPEPTNPHDKQAIRVE